MSDAVATGDEVVEQFDVVVLGTGAAGLTAAVVAAEGGARVAVFEKADAVGGTSAWSGSQVWIPNNPHMSDVGVADSREKAMTYVMSLSRGLLEERLVGAYVDAGPEMVELLEAKTPVQFYALAGMPDYHPEFPGSSPCVPPRAHDASCFDGDVHRRRPADGDAGRRRAVEHAGGVVDTGR